jgi:hypothetical protein
VNIYGLFECGERGPKDVLVDVADAEQESGVGRAACETEVIVLGHQHAMQVYGSRSSVSSVRCRHVPIGSSAVYGWLAGCDVDGVGEVGRNEFPCDVRTTRVRAPRQSWAGHMFRACVSTFSVQVSKL